MTAFTLAHQIQSSAVTFESLQPTYGPMLGLVREMIGLVPNCDLTLEIWPPGFRTYNLLVPNLLNMPFGLIGKPALKRRVALGMYVSSRAAGCMYCSAHTCSFALRRGVGTDVLSGHYAPVEAAVASLAEDVSSVPAALDARQVAELTAQLGGVELERIVHGIAMMGFLNKFMDAMGIPLESGAIDDVQDLIGVTGWHVGHHVWENSTAAEHGQQRGGGRSNGARAPGDHSNIPIDSFGTYLRVLRLVPGALAIENGWMRRLKQQGPSLLALTTDSHEPVYAFLNNLGSRRAKRAITAAIAENLDGSSTRLGLDNKCLIAHVFAAVVGNDALAADAARLSRRFAPGVSPQTMAALDSYASSRAVDPTPPAGLPPIAAAAVRLARAASPSPAQITPALIQASADALTPAQIVEAMVWLAVQQLLHRLQIFDQASVRH
jgi:alkylhydroperoxidase family enzyme